jgi:hypothetical protein
LDIGFIDHLYTRLLISTIHKATRPFPACSVFTRRSLVTASNSGDSSASALKSSLHRLPYRTDSESELLYDWRFTANQFVLATNHLRLTTNIFFQLHTCGHSPYVTSSLTRGWVCRLRLLLALASAVILRSEFHATLTTFYCLRFETAPTGGPGPRIYIAQDQGGPVIPPGTWFPFHRLLRLAGLRWRYSNTTPHG